MSDKTSEGRSARGRPGLILSGLAAGAILGAPVIPIAEPVTAEPVAATSPAGEVEAAPTESTGSSIRDQFRTSFTAGAMTDPAADPISMPVITLVQ